MVVNPDGLVLTNNHVIDDSTNLAATVPATGKTYAATAVGYDKTGDVALIKLRQERVVKIGTKPRVLPISGPMTGTMSCTGG